MSWHGKLALRNVTGTRLRPAGKAQTSDVAINVNASVVQLGRRMPFGLHLVFTVPEFVPA